MNAPALAALKPVRGSLRLIGMRLALSGLAALPAILAALGALEDPVGRRPFFADAPDPLPLLPTLAMLDELGLSASKGLKPLRVALTGSSVSPPLFESIVAVGRESTVARFEAALARL